MQVRTPVEAPAEKAQPEPPRTAEEAEARDQERVLIEELLESPHMTDSERQTAKQAIEKMTLRQLHGYHKSLTDIVQKRDRAGKPQETQASFLQEPGPERNAVLAGR